MVFEAPDSMHGVIVRSSSNISFLNCYFINCNVLVDGLAHVTNVTFTNCRFWSNRPVSHPFHSMATAALEVNVCSHAMHPCNLPPHVSLINCCMLISLPKECKAPLGMTDHLYAHAMSLQGTSVLHARGTVVQGPMGVVSTCASLQLAKCQLMTDPYLNKRETAIPAYPCQLIVRGNLLANEVVFGYGVVLVSLPASPNLIKDTVSVSSCLLCCKR